MSGERIPDKEYWALLYLVDWDPSGQIFPDIHAIYDTWQEAERIRKEKIHPEKYWVRRVRLGWPR